MKEYNKIQVDRKKCIIHVPKGSLELYRKAPEWKEFENIVEYKKDSLS